MYFKGIGGVDRAMLRGRRVIVHGVAGPVPGVTGHLAIHMQEPDDRKKVPEFHEVFIDIGVGSKAEAEKLVRVGDAVTMDGDVFRLAGDRIAARACDNRIGTWSAAEALRHLSAERERLSAQCRGGLHDSGGERPLRRDDGRLSRASRCCAGRGRDARRRTFPSAQSPSMAT